jgi:hypothetical protein
MILESRGLVWYIDGSGMPDGCGIAMCRVRLMWGLSFSLGVHATVFQTESFAILACAKEYKKELYKGANL